MSRASTRGSNLPAAAANNVGNNGGHSDPSCSSSLYQSFRPVTRSMTHLPASIVDSSELKGGGSASTSTRTRRSIADASFSIQSAALQSTVTRARTPHKVTPSVWKPLTQPVALSEAQKCASLTTMKPTSKRSRVASTQAAKDPTNHLASKANSIVLTGKKNRDEETTSQGDQTDAVVVPSPTKKLQTCKFPSDTCSKRLPSIRILGGEAPSPLPTGKSMSEGHKCASLTTMNPIAKRSIVASTRAARDHTDYSASKANSIVLSGKKNRDEETTSQGDLSDVVVMPSPTKKLQTCKFPSDTCSKKIPPIRILGGKSPAPLPTRKSRIESGKNSASVPANVASASANDISLSTDAAVPLPGRQPQLDTAKNSSVITKSVNNEASQVKPLSAKAVNLPGQKLHTSYPKIPFNVPMEKNRVSGLAGVTAPMALPKLQIGNVKDTSNVLSNSYARALLIKRQQLLLQQYKLESSQQQLQKQELYIKGPALPWSDNTPPIEPSGTRCELCKLDVAFRPQGDAGRDAFGPPVVAVLACHHAFHSSCIESVCGLVEPSQCIACVDAGLGH